MSESGKPMDAVLVVDDEEYVLTSLRRTFRSLPVTVLTAGSGAQALELMETSPVRVVIADQRMPGMLGTELLAKIKERWPHVIRIVLSAYTEVPALLRAINEGEVYRFISKPWDDRSLRGLVERAVAQSRVIEEMVRLTSRLQPVDGQDGVKFKVDYLGNLIRMELIEARRPLSAEQIMDIMRHLFDLSPGSSELEALGNSLVRQNGKLTIMTQVGQDIHLILEFPIAKFEGTANGLGAKPGEGKNGG